MERLSKLIESRLNHHKLDGSAKAAKAVHMANQFIDEYLPLAGNSARARKLQNGVLWVHVADSIWAQEIWGISGKLLNELQNLFGETFVKKIQTKSLTSG